MGKINRIVGVVVTAVAALAISLALIDNFTDSFGKKTYRVTGDFNNVGGLTLDAPVQIGGVIIGNVESFYFTPDGMIRVTLKLHLHRPIPVDSVMAISATAVSGDVFVNLFRGSSHEMIRKVSRREALPQLRTVDFYSIADLGGSFAKVGEAVGTTVENIGKLIGKDSTVLANVSTIELNGQEISEITTRIANRFADSQERYGKLSDQMLNLLTHFDRYSALLEKSLPLATRQTMIAELQAARQRVVGLQASLAQSQDAVAKIQRDVAAIDAWAHTVAYSPRSVVGVLLSDPHYSATATVRELKAAYYSVVDQPFIGKVAFAVRHYVRAKKIVRNFTKENENCCDSLGSFYRAWLSHESREKALNGYITQ